MSFSPFIYLAVTGYLAVMTGLTIVAYNNPDYYRNLYEKAFGFFIGIFIALLGFTLIKFDLFSSLLIGHLNNWPDKPIETLSLSILENKQTLDEIISASIYIFLSVVYLSFLLKFPDLFKLKNSGKPVKPNTHTHIRPDTPQKQGKQDTPQKP